MKPPLPVNPRKLFRVVTMHGMHVGTYTRSSHPDPLIDADRSARIMAKSYKQTTYVAEYRLVRIRKVTP